MDNNIRVSVIPLNILSAFIDIEHSSTLGGLQLCFKLFTIQIGRRNHPIGERNLDILKLNFMLRNIFFIFIYICKITSHETFIYL